MQSIVAGSRNSMYNPTALAYSQRSKTGTAEVDYHIFEKVVTLFKVEKSWSSSSAVEVACGTLSGKAAKLTLSRSNSGEVVLIMFHDYHNLMSQFISEPFVIGRMTGAGWKVSPECTKDNYRLWNLKTKRHIGKR